MFENIGLKKEESLYETWYGKIEGLFLTIEEADEGTTSCYKLASNYKSEGLMGTVLDFVENEKRIQENFIHSYNIDSEHLVINFYQKENTFNIENFIKSLVVELNKLNVKNICAHCGKEENLFFYKHLKGLSVMCEGCGENLKNEVIIAQNENPHYFRGFIGSLIGAIIGSIVWVLLGKLGWVASFAGYAIAVCAFMGYKKMKGKLTKKGVIINLITIIIAFILANLAGIVLIVKSELECTVLEAIIITPLLFVEKEVILSFLKDFAIGGLFLFLGIRTTIKSSYSTAKLQDSFTIEKLDC